jgi:hypothetical protein
MSKKEEQNLAKKVSLPNFIEQNYRLLTTMGVFGGLTTLFTRLENASYLSVISFLMFIVIGIELYRKIPKEVKSLSLAIFESLIVMLVISLTIYLLTYFYLDLMLVLPSLVIVILGFILATSMRTIVVFFLKHKTTSRILKTVGYTVLIIVIAVITFVAFVLIMYLLNWIPH